MKFNLENYRGQFDLSAMQSGFSRDLVAEVDGLAIAAFSKGGQGEKGHVKPLIYLSSGVHGDEPSGPLALLGLLKGGFFDDRADWLVCPVINPVGLSLGTRENGSGVDLNRDYLEKESVEVRAHVDWLERLPVPDMFISLHEDWESSGFYLYEINVSGVASGARDILRAGAAEIAPEAEALIDGHQVREPGWIDHSPRADVPKHWPEAIFMAMRGVGVSYTLETPSSLDLMRRVRCHQLAVSEAVRGFLLTR